MKKIFFALLVFTTLFALTGCKSDSENIRSAYNSKISDSNNYLTEDHLYKSVSAKGLEAKLLEDATNGTTNEPLFTIVFYGMPTCSACANNIKNINDAAVIVNNSAKYDIEIEYIYYLKSSKSNGDYATATFNTITKMTPTVWVFKNGVKFIDGSSAAYRTDAGSPEISGEQTDYFNWAKEIFASLAPVVA